MIGMSAVIFIPDDTAKTGYPQPLMLQSVMGAPLLAWLANALFDSGVGRFFLVCHDRYVEPSVRVAPGARLLPGTMLRGKTVIGEEAVIGPWSVIDDSVIGARAVVNASQVRESRVGQDAVVGPYASVRGGCELGRSVRAGSFVELKNARLGENTQVPHLAYLGDTEAGANCNFGCGVTTANFDRVQKHETVVGEGAFIGCNTALIAPLQVGSGAYIGAGSTITEDVPAQALGIARARQSNKKEWAAKHKK